MATAKGKAQKQNQQHGEGTGQVAAPTRRKKQRGIASELPLMEKVVLEKYPPRGNPPPRSDGQVATALGITYQAVSSLLKSAYENGVLSTQIHLPSEKQDVARLENAVRARFGLQRVLLVPGLPDMLEDLDVRERRNVHAHVVHSMVGRVAQHLDALIGRAARPTSSFTLGVAWGRTLDRIAQHLSSTPREARCPGLEVLPIVGITCESTREPTEANVIAMRIAEAYGGRASQLACPAFVPQHDVWTVTQRLEQVRRMLKKLTVCDVVLTSMGPIPNDANAAEEITLCTDRKLNEELFKAARTWQAIGEICYWLFDAQGREVKTNYTSIGLGFAEVHKIANDANRQVILVAGGDQRRFEPLRAALRARLASVLVSDTVTARFLVDESR